MATTRTTLVVVLLVLVGVAVDISEGAALKAHFYRHSCPAAEAVVRDIVLARVAADPAKLPAKLLRLFFHDCFVRVTIYMNSSASQQPLSLGVSH
jgi:peroxidase